MVRICILIGYFKYWVLLLFFIFKAPYLTFQAFLASCKKHVLHLAWIFSTDFLNVNFVTVFFATVQNLVLADVN